MHAFKRRGERGRAERRGEERLLSMHTRGSCKHACGAYLQFKDFIRLFCQFPVEVPAWEKVWEKVGEDVRKWEKVGEGWRRWEKAREGEREGEGRL